jgi:hypothetical protein
MKMKRKNHYMKSGLILILLLLATVSCEKYLDKAPSADITEKDAFGNFTSFQGFVEQMYNCMMDPDKGGAWNKYLFADETLNNYPYNFDNGNYWGNETYFFGVSVNVTSNTARDRRIWEYAWYAISVANQALEKIEEPGLFEGTAEEKNLIKGQALFFRGWFYFEICRYWGGMPYITRVLDPTESLVTPEFNRLNFQETAKKMAEDFRAAADILPNHWDQTVVGQKTLGHNRDRINKFHALSYLGKALLYGASPMMNEEATGSNTYNEAMCAQAAQAFGELLTLSDLPATYYKMQTWATYMDCFVKLNNLRPGGTEVIMTPTIYDRTRIRNSTLGAISPSSMGLNSGTNADVPTHNITKNFAMANGLPITDPASGFNPLDPWTGREPRFYKNIAIDGEKWWATAGSDQFAQLYNGGRHRSLINPPSVTGYYQKKFNGLGPTYSLTVAGSLMAFVPYMRLADVYLMYAEAVIWSAGGTPQSTSGNYTLTAEQALNVVRVRAQLPVINAKFTGSREVFFEEIVRERAVEFLFEGQRFCDLRRWNRNGDPRYLDKTAIDFDRGTGGKPINIVERLVVKRVATPKHNWLPIQVKFTKLYEGFPQNPGW